MPPALFAVGVWIGHFYVISDLNFMAGWIRSSAAEGFWDYPEVVRLHGGKGNTSGGTKSHKTQQRGILRAVQMFTLENEALRAAETKGGRVWELD